MDVNFRSFPIRRLAIAIRRAILNTRLQLSKPGTRGIRLVVCAKIARGFNALPVLSDGIFHHTPYIPSYGFRFV